MRKFLSFLLLLGLFLLSACKEQPKPEDVVGQVAKSYYEQLLQGHYEQFVDGTYQPDSIPEGYRQQLIRNAKMFVGQQNEEHRGIKQLRVVKAQADTTRRVGTVYLSLAYGDSTNEEIVVPMVYYRGVWYMR